MNSFYSNRANSSIYKERCSIDSTSSDKVINSNIKNLSITAKLKKSAKFKKTDLVKGKRLNFSKANFFQKRIFLSLKLKKLLPKN